LTHGFVTMDKLSLIVFDEGELWPAYHVVDMMH